MALLARRKNNYGPAGDALTVATRGGAAGWHLTDPVPVPVPRGKATAAANGASTAGKANGAGREGNPYA